MSFGILHIDEDFTAASFQSIYGEHGRLQHLVAVRLNTCKDTWCDETFCRACGTATINSSISESNIL